MPIEGDAVSRLEQSGLIIIFDDKNVLVEEPFPGTPLFQELQEFDFYSDRLVTLDKLFVEKSDRPAKEFFYLPAIALLMIVIYSNRKRYLYERIKV